MRNAWVVAGWMLLESANAGSAAAEPSGSPLPSLPGSDVTAHACTRCHGPEVIAKRGLTPGEWQDLVQVMIRFGAVANNDEKAEIIDYLSKAFPPKPAPDASSRP